MYILSNTWGNATAILESIFLSSIICFLVMLHIKTLYLLPFSLITADNLSIRSLLKSLFFSFLLLYACCHCFTNANLTCLYTLLLPSLNPFASLINFLCLLCLWSPLVTLTIWTIGYKEIKSLFFWRTFWIIIYHKDLFCYCLIYWSTNDCCKLYWTTLFWFYPW